MRQWLAAVSFFLLIGGALLCATGLAAGVFRRWMLLPVGLSYLTMLALPCYFHQVTATPRRRLLRDAAFVLIAAAFIAPGLGLL